jgi:uncharacterized protein YyaL (SSP411 family)
MSVDVFHSYNRQIQRLVAGACCGLSLAASLMTTALQAQEADSPASVAAQTHPHTNALIDSDSPYLLQHAHNPVHWLPWGPAAFAKAKAENKPIFVSIGYSTCYWCHVMERESFENEEIAAVINEHYIAIKVDREQRPDIDEQMMLATQLLTGRGGWPTSVWLTVDGRPWMAGTYFPPAQFTAALKELSRIWHEEADAVEKQAAALTTAIRQSASQGIESPSTPRTATRDKAGLRPLTMAMRELEQLFDEQHAGFGSQPKFPPHGPLRLLAQAARLVDPQPATAMLSRTLNALYRGGIHDHVGGGYHRYSTDSQWLLPHFEKMLYDNAQLLRAFSEAYELTGDELYHLAARDIVDWVAREMTHPAGGFYSALDSESDGVEGRFYTWSMEELKHALRKDELELFASVYNIQDEGNFTEEASGERPGTNIPFLSDPPPKLDQAVWQQLQLMREKLRTARATRSYPRLDDKVLTVWNGLMISALAHASRVFQEPDWESRASQAAEFVLSELQPDEHLLHTWRNESASIPAYLDDYAFLCEGLLELHQTTDEQRWLDEAQSLADSMLELFEDNQLGGFYFTSAQHEQLLMRSKNLLGGGNLPSGNGVALQVLLRLHTLTGNAAYLHSARRGLIAFEDLALRAPRQVEHIVLAYATLAEIDAVAAGDSARPLTGKNGTSEPPDDQQQAAAITADLFLSHDQRAPGEALMAAVRISIHDSFHLYGPPPDAGSPPVQATTVGLVPQPQLEAGEVKVPSGIAHEDAVLGGKVTVYLDEIWFYVPITVVNQAVPGEVELKLQLNYQACDSTRCLQPSELILSAPLTITRQDSSPAASSSRHSAIFGRMPK